MTEEAPERTARRPRNGRERPLTASDVRGIARDRLIESRLTPNAISLTGFAGNLVAAGLILADYFFLAGIAFILGSLMDMFDGRYSRMSGKGTKFGAFLDSTLDRIEEGVVLAAIATYFAKNGDEVAVGAVVLDGRRLLHGQLHPGARRGAGGGVQGRRRLARRAGRDPFGRPRFRQGRRPGRLRAAGARHLRDGRA